MPYPANKSLSWGNITGTLSDQTDLQDELDRIEGLIPPSSEWVDVTSDTYWESDPSSTLIMLWTTQWEGNEAAPGVSCINRLAPVGTWIDGLRPSGIRMTVNSGIDQGGALTACQITALTSGSNYTQVLTFDFDSWNQDKDVELVLADPEVDLDITQLRFSTDLMNSGPIIKQIEFLVQPGEIP